MPKVINQRARLRETKSKMHLHRHELTVNLKTAETRKDKLYNKEYLVVPAVMMVVGVHNGSQGPLFYPEDELQPACPHWNHMPITILHPEKDGEGISGRSPEVLNEQGVGILFNTRWDGGQKTECWFDEERLKEVSPETKKKIDNGEMVEVSTGLYAEHDPAPKGAIWNGEKYKAVARNHRPDHFAILPGGKGSCSLADGAGLLRNADHSARHKENLLSKAVKAKDPNGWTYVEDHTDSHVMYVDTKGDLMREGYTVDKSGTSATLDGKPEKIIRKMQYCKPGGDVVANYSNWIPKEPEEDEGANETTQNEKKEINVMNKTQLIAALLANAAGIWTESDRAYLEGRDEKWLQAQNAALTPKPTGNGKPPAEKDAVDPEDEAEAKADAKKKKMAAQAAAPAEPEAVKNKTAEEHLEELPAEIADTLRDALQNQNAEKARITKKLVGNKKCPFTANELGVKKLPELRKLLQMLGDEKPVANYAGAAEVAEPVGNSAVKPLGLPSWND